MEIEDEVAALQAIRSNTQDKERIQMITLLKGMPPDKRKDLWHGLTPEDLVGVLRSHLESGGFRFSGVVRNPHVTLGYF
jgi:Mg/Co/Ni transporter MgtE